MKKAIKQFAEKCGYRITRMTEPRPGDTAFAAMQRLMNGVDNPIIFDVGAHHGLESKAFRDLFPTSTVYAFEPFTESFDELTANTQSDPCIKAFNFGLADRDDHLPFRSNVSSATNSLLATDSLGKQTWGSGVTETKANIEAEFRTLDSVVSAMEIPRIDILKLDVQGAEHLVMNGAAKTCREGLIGLIYCEIIAQPTYSGQKRFDQAMAHYYDMNFDLYNIYNSDSTDEGRLRQVDVIFTRKPAS